METEVMTNHIIYALLGAGAYNALTFVGKAKKEGVKYDLKKALRTGVAGIIQAGLCVGTGWIPPEGFTNIDLGLVGVGATALIDNAMKILGWKVNE